MTSGAATAEVVAALRGFRFRYSNEDGLQQGLAQVLEEAGHEVEREVRLNSRDRIDILTEEGVAIEAKIAGSSTDVARQLHRYAECDRVTEILLVTNRLTHEHLPDELGGKPVHVLNIAAGIA